MFGLMPGLAAVGAPLEVDVDRPDRVGAIRVGVDLVVILRAAAAIAVVVRPVAAAARLRSRPARRRFLSFDLRQLRFVHDRAARRSARGSSPGGRRCRLRAERLARFGGGGRRGAATVRRPARGVCRPIRVHVLRRRPNGRTPTPELRIDQREDTFRVLRDRSRGRPARCPRSAAPASASSSFLPPLVVL